MAKLCFVAGPIGTEGSDERKHSDFLLRLVIDPVLESHPDFKIERADQIATPGMIDRQIITRLRDADLVIADLATLNANVFYEIGIRHMVPKPIVHMQDITQSIPFDVSLYRAVKYSLKSVQDIDRAVNDLAGQVKAALSPEHEVDNPVTRALGQTHFTQNAMPEVQLLRAELESLKSQIAPVIQSYSAVRTNATAFEGQPDFQKAGLLSDVLAKLLTDDAKKRSPGALERLMRGDTEAPDR